jgi:hypothetical protein
MEEDIKAYVRKLHEIRLDIVRTQTLNWSRHIYPFVATLNKLMDLLGMEHDSDELAATEELRQRLRSVRERRS